MLERVMVPPGWTPQVTGGGQHSGDVVAGSVSRTAGSGDRPGRCRRRRRLRRRRPGEPAARSHVPPALVGPLLLLAVLAWPASRGSCTPPGRVATILAFHWYLLPPLRDLDAATVVVLGLFLGTSVIVGVFATTTSRRVITSEQARGAIAEEQSALRRVATLVPAAPPGEVFAAVAEEAGQLLDAIWCTRSGTSPTTPSAW